MKNMIATEKMIKFYGYGKIEFNFEIYFIFK